MEWARMLAYITGTVDQELLLRNEYLAAENRILKAQLKGRLLLTEAKRAGRDRSSARAQGAGGGRRGRQTGDHYNPGLGHRER